MVDERDLFRACESLIRALRVFLVVRKQIVVLFIACRIVIQSITYVKQKVAIGSDMVVVFPIRGFMGQYVLSSAFHVSGPKAGNHGLETSRNFFAHHFLSAQLTPIHYKSSVADCVNSPLLLSRTVKVRCNALEHHDIVLLDDVDDFTLDIRQAFFYQGRSDTLSLHGGQRELFEFVRISAGACSHANDFIKHVDSRNRNNAPFRFLKSGKGIVPGPGGHGKYRGKIDYHGPRYRHYIALIPVMCRDENDWSRFHQRERFANLHLFHAPAPFEI